MKATITIIITALTISFGFTQDNNDFDYVESKKQDKEMRSLIKGNTTHGGFGALIFNYSQIDDRSAVVPGFRFGWLINHTFSIGFAGYGFFNDLDDNMDNRTALAGGYGGLMFEPVIFPGSPVHVSVPVLLGAGGLAALDEIPDFDNDPWGEYDYRDADFFFVLEPGVNLELSLVKFIRIGIGVTYRYAESLSIEDVDKNALNGLSGGLTLKFGKF